MRNSYRISLFVITALVSSTSAFAYIAPGTGATVIGALWPLVLAISIGVSAFVIKYFWKPIKGLLRR